MFQVGYYYNETFFGNLKIIKLDMKLNINVRAYKRGLLSTETFPTAHNYIEAKIYVTCEWMQCHLTGFYC